MQCPYNKDDNCEAFDNKCDLIKNCSFKNLYESTNIIPNWEEMDQEEL